MGLSSGQPFKLTSLHTKSTYNLIVNLNLDLDFALDFIFGLHAKRENCDSIPC